MRTFSLNSYADKIAGQQQLEDNQEAEMAAARANMTTIVKMLHDPRSQMMDMLLRALGEGKLCVVDVSQMRGAPALILSGLILQKIFDHNQNEFTKAEPATIPTIAVIEEAQSVLGGAGGAGEGPYVAWVKEGRKYDLGAVMITQQPGSISQEILSQGDNWFVFHLLSASDLQTLKRANAHYSDDILSSLLNEPIQGHAVFWSSAGGRSYPIPVRVLSFERMFTARDLEGERPPEDTYAARLRREYERAAEESVTKGGTPDADRSAMAGEANADSEESGEGVDVYEAHCRAAIRRLQQDDDCLRQLRDRGMPWGVIKGKLKDYLPEVILAADREQMAYQLVPRFLTETFGEEDAGWRTEKRPRRDGGGATTWVVAVGE